jgi:hypothetical protein
MKSSKKQFEYQHKHFDSSSLRRTFAASTLCATKQLNKIPPSSGTVLLHLAMELLQSCTATSI